jgi:CoA:oxalate CoA-transferase
VVGVDRDGGGLDRALEACTVLDLSQQLPGPYATMLLRGLGARVIKIEPPGGEPARVIDPPMFALLNTGKESIELDLRTDPGRALLDRLVRRCDVLVEGFRPGVTSRLGCPYETVSALRPDVVYCSISGYGQDGPYRGLPGHDLNYLGVGGGIQTDSLDETEPGAQPIGIPMVDLATGTTAALAILAALRERDQTGRGQYLDMALLDTAVFWSTIKGWGSTAGSEPAYAVVRAADGRWLTLAVIEDKFWRRLCLVLGWHDWLDDPELSHYARRQHRADEVLLRLRNALAQRPRAAWLKAFADADVPAAPAHDRDDVARDPQVVARGLFAAGVGPLRPPLPLGATATVPAQAPALDGAGAALRAELAADEPVLPIGCPTEDGRRPARPERDRRRTNE